MFWFYHRNNLKRTTQNDPIFLDQSAVLPLSFKSSQLLVQLESLRAKLVTLLMDDDMDCNKDDRIDNIMDKYLSMFRGFVFNPSEESIYATEGPYARSPFRHRFRWQWEDSVVDMKLTVNDTLFELVSVLISQALWLMIWVRNVSLTLPMNYIPQHIVPLQKILRKSAGLFQIVYRVLLPNLPPPLRMNFDSCPHVIQTYYHQCLAEAWELPFIKVLQDLVMDSDTWQLNPYGGPYDPKSIAQLALVIHNNFKRSLDQIRLVLGALTLNNVQGISSEPYIPWATYIEIKFLYYLAWYIVANAYDRWLSIGDLQKAPLQIIPELVGAEKIRKSIKRSCKKYNSTLKNKDDRIITASLMEELRLYMLMMKEQIGQMKRPSRSEFVTETIPTINLQRDMRPFLFEMPPFDALWSNKFYDEFGAHQTGDDLRKIEQLTKAPLENFEISIPKGKKKPWTRWFQRSSRTKTRPESPMNSGRLKTHVSLLSPLAYGPTKSSKTIALITMASVNKEFKIKAEKASSPTFLKTKNADNLKTIKMRKKRPSSPFKPLVKMNVPSSNVESLESKSGKTENQDQQKQIVENLISKMSSQLSVKSDSKKSPCEKLKNVISKKLKSRKFTSGKDKSEKVKSITGEPATVKSETVKLKLSDPKKKPN